jgi:hypothetical protein
MVLLAEAAAEFNSVCPTSSTEPTPIRASPGRNPPIVYIGASYAFDPNKSTAQSLPQPMSGKVRTGHKHVNVEGVEGFLRTESI